MGKTPVDVPSKNSLSVTGQCISETELTCVTPSFEPFGPKEAVVQIAMEGKDLTTTYTSFSYFQNTSAQNSLCFGPGLLEDGALGVPTSFIIQARNKDFQNRTSGMDNFQVKIMTVPEEGEEAKEIPCEIVD